MKIHPFKALIPRKDLSVTPDMFFETMGIDFSKYFDDDQFQNQNEEAIFIYQIKNKYKTYKGVVSNTELQELLDGNILFHEETIPAKEDDMVKTALERRAVVKPVMLFHTHNERLGKLINEHSKDQDPNISFTLSDGNTHSLWMIKDQSVVEDIKNIFLFGIKKAYIADGHHRCSATKKLKTNGNPFDSSSFPKIFTAYFPEDELEVYDHVKMAKISDKMSAESFIDHLAEFTSIKEVDNFIYPTKKREFVVLIAGKIFKARWKKQVLKSFEVSPDALDVYITYQVVFKRILAIEDIRKDNSVSYFSGNTSLEDLIQISIDNPDSVCICQTPLSLSDIKKYSKKKLNLPPKSTWFEPRIKSGLIAQKF